MGVHVEWLDAEYTTIGVFEAGEEVLEDDEETEVSEGHIAVCFAVDELVVLEGSPERVAEVLRIALNAAEERITEATAARTYMVSWAIEVDAHTPQEAAEKSLEIMRDPESQATHFLVENYDQLPGIAVSVDLLGADD